MPEITDEESLNDWLNTRPREDAHLIAARAALRGLPGLVRLFESKRVKDPHTIILPVFRAIAVASVVGKWPTQQQGMQDSALSANSAANSARSAADSVAYFAADSAALSAAWNAVQSDVNLLANGGEHGEISDLPLWHQQDLPEGLAEAWPTLRDRLLQDDPLWHVWTDWYQDRLDGKPMVEALEVEKALIPDTDWEKGPAHVNAIIAGMIERHTDTEVPELPEPAPTPTDYLFDGEVLEVAEPATSNVPNDATEIAWTVLKETLQNLKQGGINNSMRILPAVDRTLASLGDQPDQVDIVRCGMAGMELEAFAKTADQVLMEDAAAMLKAAVAQHALFVSQFEDWQALKAKLHQPLAEREDERSAVPDAASLHQQMADDGVLSEQADARMSEEESAALPEPAVTGEVVEAEPESQRGFLRSIRAAMRAFAVDVLAKMRGHAVTGTALAIPSAAALAFVKYSDTLTTLAAKLPSEFGWVLRWIEWLKTVLG